MIPVALTRPFARRLLPLVLVAGSLFAMVVPVAHHLDARSRLVLGARERGERVARDPGRGRAGPPAALALRRGQARRPAPARGPARVHRSSSGTATTAPSRSAARPPRPSPGPRCRWWSRASRWPRSGPARRSTPLWHESLRLLGGCLLLASVLGTSLFLFPVRTVALAEERIAALLAERRVALQDEERRAHRPRAPRRRRPGAHRCPAPAARAPQAAGSPPRTRPGSSTTSTRRSRRCGGRPRRSSRPRSPRWGCLGAVRKHCASFSRATGVDISLEAPEQLPELPPPMAAGLYRIVQEALHNTVRHAGAGRASVRVSQLARVALARVRRRRTRLSGSGQLAVHPGARRRPGRRGGLARARALASARPDSARRRGG